MSNVISTLRVKDNTRYLFRLQFRKQNPFTVKYSKKKKKKNLIIGCDCEIAELIFTALWANSADDKVTTFF